eukprot:5946884-Karenia_brevis.AAC.1
MREQQALGYQKIEGMMSGFMNTHANPGNNAAPAAHAGQAAPEPHRPNNNDIMITKPVHDALINYFGLSENAKGVRDALSLLNAGP